jgi:hypothetical protein
MHKILYVNKVIYNSQNQENIVSISNKLKLWPVGIEYGKLPWFVLELLEKGGGLT